MGTNAVFPLTLRILYSICLLETGLILVEFSAKKVWHNDDDDDDDDGRLL